LHGIGFIYDEDRDNRVLEAIDLLRHHREIIAVREHEGGLAVFTRAEIPGLSSGIDLTSDSWGIDQFVLQSRGLENRRWFDVLLMA
jgi:hypothetical protein